MKILNTPAKIIATSLALIAVTYFISAAVTRFSMLSSERINSRTEISLNNSEITLKLVLPKGMWSIRFSGHYEDVSGSFDLSGENINQVTNDSKGVIFHTKDNFTKVLLKCRFDGNYEGKYLQIRATF